MTLPERAARQLIQSDGAAIAIAPLVRKGIGGAQVLARCKEKQRSAHAVRDMQAVGLEPTGFFGDLVSGQNERKRS